MTIRYASEKLFELGCRHPIEDVLVYQIRNKYGITEYPTTKISQVYRLDPSRFGEVIPNYYLLYDEQTNRYYLSSNGDGLNHGEGDDDLWFTLDWLLYPYDYNLRQDPTLGISPTNELVDVYRTSDKLAVPALRYADPFTGEDLYLVRETYGTFDYHWYNADDLTSIGYTTSLSSPKEFCIKNVGRSTDTLSITISDPVNQTLYYSGDGDEWFPYTSEVQLTLSPGGLLYFKGSRTNYSVSNYLEIHTDMSFEASGNVMSLIVERNFDDILTIPGEYAFYRLFYNCKHLITPPELPFTSLSVGCYYNMFMYCSDMVTAPYLPALVGVSSCYRQMFYGCTSLSEISVNLRSGYGSNATTNWVRNVTSGSGGSFYKNSQATFWDSLTAGTNGVPTDWSVYDLSASRSLFDIDDSFDQTNDPNIFVEDTSFV